MSIFSKIKNHHYVTLAAWCSRGVQAVLQVLMLSILTETLDVSDYAVFILISSLLVWFMLSDMGMGYALQNKISKLKAKNLDYEEFIASVYFNGLIVFFFLFMVCVVVSYTLAPMYLEKHNGNQSYHYEFLLSAVLMVCIGVFGMVYKVWYALGKGYWSSIVPALGTLCAYLLLLLLHRFEIDSDILVFFVYFFPLAFLPFVFYIKSLFFLRKKIVFSFDYIFSIVGSAKNFLLFGFMSALVLNVDFFIASQLLPSVEIVQYHTLLKLFNFTFFLYGAFLMAVWPIISEKIEVRESYLVFGMVKKFIFMGIILVALFTFFLILFGPHIYELIIRNMKFEISNSVVFMFGLYFIVRVWTDTFAMILQSGSNLRPLIKSVPIQATISISLQLLLVSYYQIHGLLAALILSFMLTVAWYLPYSSYKFLKENSGHAI